MASGHLIMPDLWRFCSQSLLWTSDRKHRRRDFVQQPQPHAHNSLPAAHPHQLPRFSKVLPVSCFFSLTRHKKQEWSHRVSGMSSKLKGLSNLRPVKLWQMTRHFILDSSFGSQILHAPLVSNNPVWLVACGILAKYHISNISRYKLGTDYRHLQTTRTYAATRQGARYDMLKLERTRKPGIARSKATVVFWDLASSLGIALEFQLVGPSREAP